MSFISIECRVCKGVTRQQAVNAGCQLADRERCQVAVLYNSEKIVINPPTVVRLSDHEEVAIEGPSLESENDRPVQADDIAALKATLQTEREISKANEESLFNLHRYADERSQEAFKLPMSGRCIGIRDVIFNLEANINYLNMHLDDHKSVIRQLRSDLQAAKAAAPSGSSESDAASQKIGGFACRSIGARYYAFYVVSPDHVVWSGADTPNEAVKRLREDMERSGIVPGIDLSRVVTSTETSNSNGTIKRTHYATYTCPIKGAHFSANGPTPDDALAGLRRVYAEHR